MYLITAVCLNDCSNSAFTTFPDPDYRLVMDTEITLVKEDVKAFSLLAEGINRLQSVSNPVPESYMDFYFPTLLQLQHI